MMSDRISNRYGVDPAAGVQDLCALVRYRARVDPEQIGFTFLADGETQEQHLSFGELDRQARALAGKLQTVARPGDRVLLLFEPGLEYITAFFGVCCAGMIPVPAYPPDLMRAERTLARLLSLATDCGPAVVLGSRNSLAWGASLLERALAEQAAGGSRPLVLLMEDPLGQWSNLPWTQPDIDPRGVALLQYTSGSTASPRGVMISHANLFYQMELLHRRWTQSHQENGELGVIGVSWLPLYHDLGLIGGVLAPCYAGKRLVLMSPLAFVQRPIRWLQAISRYRALISGGPNFAYDLCVQKFRPEDGVGLDLGRWTMTLTGAEPVHAATIERFNRTFAPFGFNPRIWMPSYGMAEATLGVTGSERELQCPQFDFDLAALERNAVRRADADTVRTRRLVGCGAAMTDTVVRIADPLTRRPLEQSEGHTGVGEVWVRGPGVALGYWNNPELTSACFGARLEDSGEEPFLRTGDLGFLYNGTLYLTGRLKEMMIFRGRNVYPQDVEKTVTDCHEAFKVHGGAAFAVQQQEEERLIVVQEVLRPAKHDLDALAREVFRAIAAEHQLLAWALVLIRAGTLPKTSSGKIQRNETRRKFLASELDIVRQWNFEGAPAVLPRNAAEPLPDATAIREWLRQQIATATGLRPEAIQDERPLSDYVVDSITLVAIARDLERWLGQRLDPVILFDAVTLNSLAVRLTDPVYHLDPQSSPANVRTMTEAEVDAALAKLMQSFSNPRS